MNSNETTLLNRGSKGAKGGLLAQQGITTKQKNFSRNINNSKQGINMLKQQVNTKRKTLTIGEICQLKISALGPNGIGIDEYSFGYSVFVPNTELGEKVKAKIVKLSSKDPKYAIAKVIKKVALSNNTVITPVKPGDIIDVKIQKLSGKGAGIVEHSPNYKVIVPNAQVGDNLKVAITRVKSNYCFGKLVNGTTIVSQKNLRNQPLGAKELLLQRNAKFVPGSKLTITLPKSAKQYGKYLIVKCKDSVLFIKSGLGAKVVTPGFLAPEGQKKQKVRIKVRKVCSNFAIASVIQTNPKRNAFTTSLIRHSIKQMIKNGMHFGEKAVKCNARMKNYIWLRKQGINKNRPLIKKGRHVINLLKTRRCLNKALSQLSKYALKGRTFLFIGTKKPAAGVIARASLFSKTSFFVNTRWLGGMLTNWKTIMKSISKIQPILKEKQKIVSDILEKRQSIKNRLIKKALLLKKKSKLILTKGRKLIEQFKNQSYSNQITENAKKLALKRKQFIENSQSLLAKRQILLEKRRELMTVAGNVFKEKAMLLSTNSKLLLEQLNAWTIKLGELKSLLLLSQEIENIKNLANKQNTELLSISFEKLKNAKNTTGVSGIIPNPPKDILARMILTIGLKNSSKLAESYGNINKKSTSDKKVLVLSKLLIQFSRFRPYIKSLIKKVQENIQKLEKLCQLTLTHFNQIKTSLQNSIALKNKIVSELQKIQNKCVESRTKLNLIRKKFKSLVSQKRLMKFLPRLRYLPIVSSLNSNTPQTKISETVQLLMRKIVDPKLTYPIDSIYDEKLSGNSKKVAAARKKKWQRLEKYFGGISNMTKFNKTKISKNIAIIVGQKEEMNAVRECQKLGIKTFNIVDTNCNPTLADHIIPANDDSRNSIKYILQKCLERIRLAQKLRTKFEKRMLTKAL